MQYLAAWDVHRGIVLGRCEAKTGIKPFGRLVDQVLEQEPYRDAERLFYVVDNGSSHRGQTSVERMRRRDKRIILVHTPVHASWLNQVEIYFSIIQRKVLTPNDFATLDAVRLRLALYEQLSNRTPRPFAWKFTRQDLLNWLKRAPALLSSLRCLTPEARITTTLFVKRTTKGFGVYRSELRDRPIRPGDRRVAPRGSQVDRAEAIRVLSVLSPIRHQQYGWRHSRRSGRCGAMIGLPCPRSRKSSTIRAKTPGRWPRSP